MRHGSKRRARREAHPKPSRGPGLEPTSAESRPPQPTNDRRAAAHDVPEQSGPVVLDHQRDRPLIDPAVIRRDPPTCWAIPPSQRLIEGGSRIAAAQMSTSSGSATRSCSWSAQQHAAPIRRRNARSPHCVLKISRHFRKRSAGEDPLKELTSRFSRSTSGATRGAPEGWQEGDPR